MGKGLFGIGKYQIKKIKITQDIFEFLEDLIKDINDAGEQTDEIVNKLEKIIAGADIISGDFFIERKKVKRNRSKYLTYKIKKEGYKKGLVAEIYNKNKKLIVCLHTKYSCRWELVMWVNYLFPKAKYSKSKEARQKAEEYFYELTRKTP